MKLQKIQAVKVGEKTYSKYQITISPKLINDLGWEPGQKLKGEINEGNLIINKDDGKTEEMMIYEEFMEKIKKLLEEDDYLTWEEIRRLAKLKMKVPNHHWVNRLKEDIGLQIDVVNNKKVWKIQEFEEIFEPNGN